MSDIFNIIIKELNNSATESELQRLQVWLEEDEDNIILKNQFLTAWKDEYIDLDKVEQSSWERIKEGIEQGNSKKDTHFLQSITYYFNNWQKIAATVLLLIVSIISYTYFSDFKRSDKPITEKSLEYDVHTTKLGEQKEIVLEDSSIVFLKSDSRLEIPAVEDFMKARRVKLSGQAYFHVNASTTNPFVVVSNTFKTRVTGTIFNINDFVQDDKQEIAVLEGKVQISLLSSLDKNISVSKNEVVTYNKKSKSLEKRKAQMGIKDWADGNLVFDRNNFGSIVAELQRYFNINIKVDNESINQKKTFVGVFYKDESINDVLEVLSSHFNFSYKINEDEITIN